jgi:hypothetical protein
MNVPSRVADIADRRNRPCETRWLLARIAGRDADATTAVELNRTILVS